MLIEDVIAKVHCHSLTRVTLFALLKARYIEDQILLDSVNKYSKLSDSSISELMKVTGLDITEGMQNFISKRDALSNVFVRLHHAVDASGEVNTHACGVVGTKLLDYIEDVLLFATNSRVRVRLQIHIVSTYSPFNARLFFFAVLYLPRRTT
jgi:hypothetical protein